MLAIENFSLSYGEGEPVLQDITLSLKAGECLVVTGESGSGKSSLIHAINGLAFTIAKAWERDIFASMGRISKRCRFIGLRCKSRVCFRIRRHTFSM